MVVQVNNEALQRLAENADLDEFLARQNATKLNLITA
jgi:hypothetical protein